MIPVNEPRLGPEEVENVLECVRSGWISSEGQFIRRFEEMWARYCGVEHGVAVTNGTAALEAAVECLGLGPGDEVIMPTFTIISCALAAIYAGARPVLVDSEPRTWCMDVSAVESRITPKTRAIMVVHMYGHPVNMAPIWELAQKHGLVVIEDAAEAHGAEYQGRRCGGLGDLGCFSFFANKIVTTGEGGMVVTNNAAYAERLRSIRNLGFRPERRFFHTSLGRNLRMTNMQAAVGVAQVGRIAQALEHKRWMAAAYTSRLQKLGCLQLPVQEAWARNVYWMYGMVIDSATGLTAETLASRLVNRSVMTRPFFLGMHEQPVLRERGLFGGESYPVAERLARQGLYLPSGLALQENQLDQVCQAVEECVA